AYLDLATFYGDYRNHENAARCLLEYLEEFPESEDRLKVLLRAADFLYRSGRRGEAKRLYLGLLESHPEARVSGVHGIDETETVRDYVLRRLADPGLAGVGVDEEMALRFPSRMIWRAPADLLATSRTFLIPEGAPPPPMRECFLTQSAERIQCRRADTGLPVWTIHLRRIPGFLLVPERFGISFPRTGDKLLEGAYSGSSLVLHDHRNLFAVDVEKGAVRWHLPLEEGGISERALSPPTLSERIRGAKIGEDAVFVATSRKKLYRFDLQGEKTWEREIDSNPATSAPLIETGESIFVLGQRPVELREYRKSDGSEIGPLREAFAEGVLQLEPRPVEVAESLLLIAFTSPARTAHIRLVDLRRREMRWELTHARTRVRELFHFPAEPDEAILVLEPESRIPVLVGLSVRSGREIWRYQRFEEADVTLSVARDGDRVYVIHGASAEISTWKLLALQMSRGADRGKLQLVPIWKPKEISLGFSYSSRKRLLITEDSILYPEHATLSVYDKLTGKTRSADQDLLNRFLVEKGSSTSEIIGGKLIILTDGGDCALAAVPDIEDRERSRQRLRLIRDHLRDPSAPGLVAELALDYFRDGDRDGVRSAINVLDRALSSEAVLAAADQETLAGLAFLLDGFKEEAMKVLPEIEIQSRRLWMPPRIDGEMDDSWNLAHQVRLSTPRHIGRIGNPGHEFSWEGEEDLSAILYTGWDDENFYFALDVDDDVLRAYDKEATVWKGDCLLIGVDTEGDGGYQHGPGDQLMTLALTIPKRKQPQEDEDDPLGGGEDDAEAADGDEKPDGQFSVKRRDDDSGAVYEVAIPWRSFAAGSPRGQRPPRGFRFGLSLLLLDDDSGTGATKTLSLNPCHLLPRDQKSFSIWKFLIPQFFPRIVLR
ncbi:MAG: PQQ-binding-like beta-propeller repeat protein, partial [Planctomycetes bacterium]|nr:PQQ-binding-like beta-propeller repeat protein [Planctomycetota bacterium]